MEGRMSTTFRDRLVLGSWYVRRVMPAALHAGRKVMEGMALHQDIYRPESRSRLHWMGFFQLYSH